MPEKKKDTKKGASSESPRGRRWSRSNTATGKFVDQGRSRSRLQSGLMLKTDRNDREMDDTRDHKAALTSLRKVDRLVADMQRDQQEIDQLKSETRQILQTLSAV